MPIRILHFSDAHIDMANYGRLDTESMLPVRVTDYLRSLDTVVTAAVREQADLVLFGGDAYKDRNPQPTFQREWHKRIMQLSQAGIPTLLLVGNHDVSPSYGRASTVAEFRTLQVPRVVVADQIRLYGPEELGVELEVITVPWVPRSHLMARTDMAGRSVSEIYQALEERVVTAVEHLLDRTDSRRPTVLAAHASVVGAVYGSERAVMLGHELVLPESLVRDPRLDYVALGHIHRHQDLNPGGHPPVVYAGSIERVDFGEADQEKGYVLAQVSRGQTDWRFVPLPTRKFLDLAVTPRQADTAMAEILGRLPPPDSIAGAVVRLQLTYPADWEAMIDDRALEQALAPALESRVIKNRQTETRVRLGDAVAVEALAPPDLLSLYWRTIALELGELEHLQGLGQDIIRAVDQGPAETDGPDTSAADQAPLAASVGKEGL
jgi:exonuclease SbcD